MRNSFRYCVTVFALGAMACSKSSAPEGPKAEILEAPAAVTAAATAMTAAPMASGSAIPVPTASGTAAAAETIVLTAANTTVAFTGSKVGGGHNGTFGKVTGEVKLGVQLEASELNVEIDIASLHTDSTKLDNHLKSEDFFEVAKFAKATFKSTVIVPTPGKPDMYSVTGIMDIKGVRKTLKFPAKIERKAGGGVTANASFVIGRKGFHVDSDGLTDYLIKDEVGLSITIK